MFRVIEWGPEVRTNALVIELRIKQCENEAQVLTEKPSKHTILC